VNNLTAALPHRAPMIWIDEVLSGSHEGGVCRVRPQRQALYRDADGSFLKYAGLEWIAQAFGYSRALHEAETNPELTTAKNAFLVGIRTTLMRPVPSDEESLLIETKLFKELPPLALVDGIVRSELTGEEYVRVQLKLFFE
jgi:predicted hotdog family 3-hydroxylacyl-ACP dehydratase